MLWIRVWSSIVTGRGWSSYHYGRIARRALFIVAGLRGADFDHMEIEANIARMTGRMTIRHQFVGMLIRRDTWWPDPVARNSDVWF